MQCHDRRMCQGKASHAAISVGLELELFLFPSRILLPPRFFYLTHAVFVQMVFVPMISIDHHSYIGNLSHEHFALSFLEHNEF